MHFEFKESKIAIGGSRTKAPAIMKSRVDAFIEKFLFRTLTNFAVPSRSAYTSYNYIFSTFGCFRNSTYSK